jgi:enoyl-[acyl-carrier protein] reductase II
MVWCSGWRLASAVSNAGGLGLIGSGSMTPEVLDEHIRKCKEATEKPFGVNVPLLYPRVEETFEKIINSGVRIVFTSAGSPSRWTARLQQHGITVVHVIASVKAALKSMEAGVDAIVAEGFEAGGHNGKEENTTFTLIPIIREKVPIPLIAAGGVATGRGMMAAFALGAEGVQIGTRFAASEESSAHINFKEKIVGTRDGDTFLTLKKIVPVRLIRNAFFNQVQQMEAAGEPVEKLIHLLGNGRSRKGMFEGNLEEGELEAGEVSALIHDIQPAGQIVEEILREFETTRQEINNY